jgi:hypothetical protein
MAQHMDSEERLQRLEDELADVVRRLRELERREEATGTRPVAPPAESVLTRNEPEVHVVPEAPTMATGTDITGIATLLGRSFVVFGGAYLLRALTESGRLPHAGGIIIGLAYAIAWLVAAHRTAAARPTSAQFHGVTAVLIGWPIVWEAATRFGLLAPAAAAALLAVLTAAACVVATRGRLDAVLGAALFGTVLTSAATASATNHFGAFALLLIVTSGFTYWERSWVRWPMAIAAGLSVMAVTARAIAAPPLEPAWLALGAQGAWLVTMQGTLAIRVIMRSKPVRLFDVLQAACGLVIGVGGAVLVARSSPAGLGLIGAVTALLAAGAYLGAIFRLTDRPHLLASYHTFTTFGLVALVAALVLLLSGTGLALTALALAVGAIAIGPQRLAGAAPFHGAVYVMTALAASGALTTAAGVWTTRPAPWPSMTLVAWLALVVTAACATMRPTPHGNVGDLITRIGRLLIAASCVFVAGGAAVMLLAPMVAGTPPDAGILASLRTALLSVSVVALGAAGRWTHTAIFARLVYPVLALGGVRLLVDDFRHSEPSTMFLALALYGVALAFGPRLAARRR